MLEYVQNFFLKSCVCEECALYVPISRLIGRSGFGYYLGHVDGAISNNNQEIIYLGSGLRWNNADVCGGRKDFKIVMRYLSDWWKYFDSESAMMFSVLLMCW